MEDDSFIAWTSSMSAPAVSIIKPFDGQPATVGNGSMCALSCDSREKVDKLHKKALELGGKCEGEPGPRGDGGMYFAYFRDLDGNKLAAFTMSPS
jgi:predicted lactoylglutathione lyase